MVEVVHAAVQALWPKTELDSLTVLHVSKLNVNKLVLQHRQLGLSSSCAVREWLARAIADQPINRMLGVERPVQALARLMPILG